MYGFLIKKAFFDMWDNLFATVILNVGFVLVLVLAYFVPDINSLSTYLLIDIHPILKNISELIFIFITIFIKVSVLFIYIGAVSSCAGKITDYERVSFKDFLIFFKESLKTNVLFALVNSVFILISFNALSYYMSMDSILGVVLFTAVFWFSLLWIFSSQYFFPLQSRISREFKKNMRKMFYIFFDNTFLTIFLFIISIAALIISVFAFLLLPGITFLLILTNTALKLRLLKYDYLEDNPNANPKKVPWDALLMDEKKRVGKRTFKGMIFPWKE